MRQWNMPVGDDSQGPNMVLRVLTLGLRVHGCRCRLLRAMEKRKELTINVCTVGLANWISRLSAEVINASSE